MEKMKIEEIKKRHKELSLGSSIYMFSQDGKEKDFLLFEIDRLEARIKELEEKVENCLVLIRSGGQGDGIMERILEKALRK